MAQQQQETATQQQSFLEKVIDRSPLETINQAQTATNVVFRILRDMVSKETSDRVAEELRQEAPRADMEVKDLWQDTNFMVAFFSRISPMRPLEISPSVFKTRLDQEGSLPADADTDTVAKAVFSATKEELTSERSREIASYLPEEIRQLWEQA